MIREELIMVKYFFFLCPRETEQKTINEEEAHPIIKSAPGRLFISFVGRGITKCIGKYLIQQTTNQTNYFFVLQRICRQSKFLQTIGLNYYTCKMKKKLGKKK